MPNPATNQPPLARAGVARGCGEARTQGAVYLECGVGVGGAPLEQLLVDPPKPYTTDQKIGVTLVPVKGVYHVIDWVGEQHYPMPTDFLEEGRLHGFSRKVSRNLDFDKLTPDSRVYFVHPKAVVANAADLAPHLPDHRLKGRCARFAQTGDETHLRDGNVSCTRYWYALAEANGTRITSDDRLLPERRVSKDTAYLVEPLPQDAPEPQYRSGIIAIAPITAITVVAAKDDSHKATVERIAKQLQGRLPILERPA